MSPNPVTVITSRPPEATTATLKIHLLLAPLPTPPMRPPLPLLQRMEPVTPHRQSTPFPAVLATPHRQSTPFLKEPATHLLQSTPLPAGPATRHRQPPLSLMEPATLPPQSTTFLAGPATLPPQSTPSPLKPHIAQAQAPT